MDGDIQQRPAGFQAVLLLLPGTKHGRKKSLPFLVVVVFERSGCCCYYNQSKHEKKFPFRPWMELEKKKGIPFLSIQAPTGIQLRREDESARTQSAGIGCRCREERASGQARAARKGSGGTYRQLDEPSRVRGAQSSQMPALYPGGEKDLGKRPSRETKSWVAPRLGGSRQTSSCCHGRRGSLMASRVYSGSGSSRAGREMEMEMEREVGDEDEGRPEGRNE